MRRRHPLFTRWKSLRLLMHVPALRSEITDLSQVFVAYVARLIVAQSEIGLSHFFYEDLSFIFGVVVSNRVVWHIVLHITLCVKIAHFWHLTGSILSLQDVHIGIHLSKWLPLETVIWHRLLQLFSRLQHILISC